jgi:uncharacterized RDD family membrane protein YckC
VTDEPGSNLPSRPQPSLPARLAGAGARAGQRAAEVTGIDSAVQLAAEEAIVRAAESPAVERALVRVLQGPAVREAAAGAINSPEVERAIQEALDSEMIDRIWARLLESDETQALVERIAEAPEVRAAITQQGVGLLQDVGRQIGEVTRRVDDLLERIAWRLTLRRGRRTEPAREAGAFSRLLAFAIDAGLMNASFLLGSALVSFIARELFGGSGDLPDQVLVVGTGAWLTAIGAYLTLFWSLSGETPGMRFLGLRLGEADTHGIGFRRAVRRLIWQGLSFLAFGLGFLGILRRDDRRGWADRRAGTVVLYVDDPRALAAARRSPRTPDARRAGR